MATATAGYEIVIGLVRCAEIASAANPYVNAFVSFGLILTNKYSIES